jgi:type I restriction enzyme, R subunit
MQDQDLQHTEKPLSQIPALQLLINLGCTYLTPAQTRTQRYNKTNHVLLEPILTAQLKTLNQIQTKGRTYSFSEENIQTAIQKLKNIRYNGLLNTNEAIYDFLTLGTSLEQTIDGNTKSYSLRYIDWQTPTNNVYHVTAEFPVECTRSTTTKYPDIVLFINGIPFAAIECKAPNKEIDEAISDLINKQHDDAIPKLFTYTQLLLATNKNTTRYATTGTRRKFWATWHEELDTDSDLSTLINQPLTPDQTENLFQTPFADHREHFDNLVAGGDRQITAQDRAIYSLLRPDRLLELTYQFTIFDSGERKLARYQQYFTVQSLLQRVKPLDSHDRRQGGVIWHTQGSGKSLTMVMMAKALILDPAIPNPRIVIVTDRIDLDTQIKKTFTSCGFKPIQATSGRHLISLIEDETVSVVTTLINKFSAALNIRKVINDSPNIFILVDESHRSQSGNFHPKMRQVFPKGCYLGFTGTPLLKKEKNTFQKFGGMIGEPYTIRRAVKDQAVVPLLYEGRHSEQEVNSKAIDTWFDRLCHGLTDEQKADLKHKFSSARQLNASEQTIYCRAFDISEHYRQFHQGTGLKAQLVASRKSAAIKYKKFLDDIGHVTSEVIISPPTIPEATEEVGETPTEEVQAFWDKMMQRYGSEKEYNKRITDGFKYGDSPEILIVVDKLLTGFDAPRNTVLYIAKSIREHNLLQAIARVNRLYENESTGANKDYGYIIDYEGLLGELDTALNTYDALAGFDAADLEGTLTDIREELKQLPQRNANLWDIFKSLPNTADEEAYELLLGDQSIRDNFYECLTQYGKTLAIALSSEHFLTETPDETIRRYQNDLKRFQNLKVSVKKRYQESIDYKDLQPKIQKLLDTYISASEVTQIVPPVNLFDEAAMETAIAQQKTSAGKADLIASAAKRTITEKMDENPAFYKPISELIQKAIDDFRAKRISDAQYLQKAYEHYQTVTRPPTEDLPPEIAANPDLFAFFSMIKPFIKTFTSDVLEKQASIAAEPEAIYRSGDIIEPPADDPSRLTQIAAESAQAIYEIIREKVIVDWQNNDNVQKAIKNAIDDYLYDWVKGAFLVDLSPEEMDDIINQSLQLARNRMPR